MRRFRPTLALLSLLALSLVANDARAYDEDTHFYGTYSMARFAGIRHEVATKIALAAQWMDESFMSDPTSLMFLPLTGVKKRRVLHFPSSRIVGSANVATQNSLLGLGDDSFQRSLVEKLLNYADFTGNVDSLNFLTQTEEDHPFASQMLMEGLKEGNLLKAAGGLHTLEDSFAHAGTAAEQGHADLWHWPDRPFASVPKYFRMTRAVFSALTAIRTMLPPEALDCEVRLTGSRKNAPNCTLSSTELANAYESNPQVRAAVSSDPLKDPDYIRVVLKDFYARAAKARYLTMDEATFDSYVDRLQLDGSVDAYAALERLMHLFINQQAGPSRRALNHGVETPTVLGGGLVDLTFMLVDMGRLQSRGVYTARDFIDYMDSFDPDDTDEQSENNQIFHGFVHSLAEELLAWRVPVPLSDTHRIEREDDKGPIREKEMQIRVQTMRTLIQNLYGTNIQLLNNTTKDEIGFAQEMRMDPRAEPRIPSSADVSYATFSGQEKYAWNVMIFRFLFPSLNEQDLLGLVETGARLKSFQLKVAEYNKKRDEIGKSADNWFIQKAKLLNLDRQYSTVLVSLPKAFASIYSNVLPIAKTYVSDIFNTHSIPDPDNYAYRKLRRYQDARACGDVKELLVKDRDFWNLETLGIAANPPGTMPNFLAR